MINHILVCPVAGQNGVFRGKQLLQQQNSATDFSNSSQTTSNKEVPPVIESCAISASGCLNMKVYCTNTCHDISQYLAMERLHPGKKTIQIFSGIDRCYNKAIKDESITEDYKILIIFFTKVGGDVAGQRKEKKIVHS